MDAPYVLVPPTFAEVEALQAASVDVGSMTELIRATVDVCVRFAPGHTLDAMAYPDAVVLFRECQEMLNPKAPAGIGTGGSPPEAASER